MKKSPDRKVLLSALLFLPIIAGILMFLALAAWAEDGQVQDKCAQGPWLESDKRVYAGVYKDLSLMGKLKVRAMPFTDPEQLDKVAVAYEFPYTEVMSEIGKAQAGDSARVFAHMILSGKVAFAKREADTLNLIASPYAFHFWAAGKWGGDVKELKWMEEERESCGGSAEEALQAWEAAWEAYSRGTQAVGWLAVGAMQEGKGAAITAHGKDFVVLSAEEAILGLRNKGRVITWDGATPLPDIDDAVTQGRDARS